MASRKRIRLSGSDRQPLAGFRSTGPIDPNEQIEITVTLKPKERIPIERKSVQSFRSGAAATPSREEARRRCSASTESVRKVEAFAGEHSLQVKQSDAMKRNRRPVRNCKESRVCVWSDSGAV